VRARFPAERALQIVIALLVVSGAAMLARGLWIPAKAVLAQWLLEDAWRRTRLGEVGVPPWPGADTWPVARLRVARLGVSDIVLEGASGSTLAFAPGHLLGSAAPGGLGNSVLAGHRDTHFAFLRDLVPGDELEVETREGRTRFYTVVSAHVAHERDLSALGDRPRSRLTLLTCFPFESPVAGGVWRYVVVAEAGRSSPGNPASPGFSEAL